MGLTFDATEVIVEAVIRWMGILSEVKLVGDHVAIIETALHVGLIKPALVPVCAHALSLLAVVLEMRLRFLRLVLRV